jgi:imidazolonepropionase-like amidohydrolase
MKLWLWIVSGVMLVSAQPMLIRDVTIVDPAGDRVTPHVSVLITRAGRIADVGAKLKPGRETRVVDGTGRFLIPGLWDMHVHLWSPKNNQPQLYLAFGVTGVRDMGSSFERTDLLRRSIESGSVHGPHIVTSGPGVDGKASDEPRLPILVVSNDAEARHAADEIKQMGADFVKVFTRIEADPYRVLLARARELHLPVVGHLPTKVRIEDAITLGQASIEHFFGMERLPEQRMRAAFASAAKQGTRFTPTLSMHKRSLLQDLDEMTGDPRISLVPEELRKDWGDPKKDFAKAPAELKAKAPGAFRHDLELTRWLKESGVTILAGTDTGDPFTIPGGSLHDELALLVAAGLTPMEALRSATSEPARFLGLSQNYGAVRQGLSADLVLLDGDPSVDIANVRKISGVWWRGQYFDEAAIAGLKSGH